MGFLAKLFGTRTAGERDDAIHLYVECERCGAKVHVRLDKRHDLSQAEGGGYFVRKEIMDGKCFRLMTAELAFDSAYLVTQQALEGGRFLTADEYRASGA